MLRQSRSKLQSGSQASSSGTALPPRSERLEAFLRQDPTNLDLLLDLAGEYHVAGKVDRAMALAERAWSMAPGSSLAAALLAMCLLAQGQVRLARETHRRFMTSVGTFEAARRFLWVFQRADKLGDYVDDLELLLATPGQDWDHRRMLIRAVHFAGNAERALFHLAVLCEQAPPTPADAAQQALLLFDTQQLPLAHAQVQRCLQQGVSSVEVHYVAASLLLLDGQIDAARHHVDQALALQPQEARCLSLQGQLDLFSRRYAQAAVSLAQAAQQMPEHVGSRHAVAWCLVLAQDLAGARAEFEQALSMNRNFAESHGGLAVVAALQQRATEARLGIARALRLDRACLSAVLAQKLLDRAEGRSAGGRLHDELMDVLKGIPAVGGGTLLQFHQRLSRSLPL